MDYNFEEIIKDKDCLLMYKKIKHFYNKDPKELYELYIKSIDDLLENDSEDRIKEKLVSAMENSLIQTEKGARLLILFAISQTLNEEVINQHIEIFEEKDVKEYYFDICEYLRSETVDVFLLEKLKNTKNKEIKENIIRI